MDGREGILGLAAWDQAAEHRATAGSFGGFGEGRDGEDGVFGKETESGSPPSASQSEAPKRSFCSDALGREGHERVKAEGCPHCGGRNCCLGTGERSGAVSLQGLRTHVQRAHQDADGAAAKEGPLARPCPSDDRRQKPGEDHRTLRRPPEHSLSLAASVSLLARGGQAQNAERDRRSR